jgi:hypothetical protein
MFRTSKCSSSGSLVHAFLWYFFHASNISMLRLFLITTHRDCWYKKYICMCIYIYIYIYTLYIYTGLFKMIVEVLTTCHTQYTSDSSICIFYLIEQHSKFLLHTLQVLCMCTLCDSTNINTIMEFDPNCFVACQRWCLLTAVRLHLSKLRSKRRNA